MKREGDLKTPVGSLKICSVRFRADRLRRPGSVIRTQALRPDQGWCDDPESGMYNRPVPDAFGGSHETLWRQDHVYDCLLITDQNSRPRVRGRGSAIFFHLAREEFSGTEGCIAISASDMRRLLPRLARNVRLVVARI
ncbi:MAG: hypothetical protein JWL93_320 [Hyphomicrobiales bacterium]|jgi:L,D-peptidoglycan transpeptidase YkuD (ErfK/YbiS/YcfS/YnhG family)|nr:hypothetical protein [Hyphomicrobiales bacterium]